MSKESLVCLLGLVVFLTPFLGVPRDVKDWILGLCGVLLMFFGYQLRRRLFLQSFMKGEERKSDAFAESVTETHSDIKPISKEETRPDEVAV